MAEQSGAGRKPRIGRIPVQGGSERRSQCASVKQAKILVLLRMKWKKKVVQVGCIKNRLIGYASILARIEEKEKERD